MDRNGVLRSARRGATRGTLELVDGEVLVTPGPHWSHQRLVLRLYRLLDEYACAQGIGEAFAAPCDVNLEPGLYCSPMGR